MKDIDAVVTDLARHPAVDFAVIVNGRLLPIRFSGRLEAEQHLADLVLADGGPIAVVYPPLSQRPIGAPLMKSPRTYDPGIQPGAGKVAS